VATEEEERNKQVLRRFYEEVVNQGNADVVDETMRPDFVHHGDALFPRIEGSAMIKGGVAGVRNAFPDGHTIIEDEIADGDTVVVRLTWTGTFTNDFMGAKANGAKCSWKGISTYRFEDGMIVERWANEDVVPQLQAMGMIPSTG
jgi:predicted ester cyclase